jgi:hypothetical protein
MEHGRELWRGALQPARRGQLFGLESIIAYYRDPSNEDRRMGWKFGTVRNCLWLLRNHVNGGKVRFDALRKLKTIDAMRNLKTRKWSVPE